MLGLFRRYDLSALRRNYRARVTGKHPGSEHINEHLPRLFELGRECSHITEFGTQFGNSTAAFLLAQPETLCCYDIWRSEQVDALLALKLPTQTRFVQESTLHVSIEPTDLLFIDTWHTYHQLRQELTLHSDRVRRHIVLHDTTTYEFEDEINLYGLTVVEEGRQGLWPAIKEFLGEHPEWDIAERYVHNNGLTVLRRDSAF